MKITKGYLKQVIAEELNKLNEAIGEADIKIDHNGQKYIITYGTEEWNVDKTPYAISITTPKGTELKRFENTDQIKKIFPIDKERILSVMREEGVKDLNDGYVRAFDRVYLQPALEGQDVSDMESGIDDGDDYMPHDPRYDS